jgi:hypothetical protein
MPGGRENRDVSIDVLLTDTGIVFLFKFRARKLSHEHI